MMKTTTKTKMMKMKTTETMKMMKMMKKKEKKRPQVGCVRIPSRVWAPFIPH